MSKQDKGYEYLSRLLFDRDKLYVSTAQLKSLYSGKPLDGKIIDLLKSEPYQKAIENFESVVEFIDDIRNPTGINKYCRDFALRKDIGEGIYEDIPPEKWDGKYGPNPKRMIGYAPKDPDLYKIIIFDNAANLQPESGMNELETITKLSKYFVTLRDQLGYTIVLIQHQSQSQESLDNFKMNKLEPNSAGLGDSKRTSRDMDVLMGLYSPYKHGINLYQGYNTGVLGDRSRFLKILEDRHYGSSNTIVPLYFRGDVSRFEELPRVGDPALEEFYSECRKNAFFLTNHKSSKRKNGRSSWNFWNEWGW